MTEQTVCLRGKRAVEKGQQGMVPSFTIVVPAHLARDFGLAPRTRRVIECDRPPQVGQPTR